MRKKTGETVMQSNKHVRFGRNAGRWTTGNPFEDAEQHKLIMDDAGDIEFSLDTFAAKKYRFNTEDPIWACKDNGQCPPPPGLHPVLQVKDCSPTRLVVHNKCRGGPMTLRYQLNVVDAGSNPKPIDPIIENKQ